MSEQMTAGQLLNHFAERIDAQDWDALGELLADDFTGRFVHTGEDFDRDRFVAFNRDYAGSWRFIREDVVDAGERGVLRARVTDGSETYFVATFVSAVAGRLTDLVEVWTDAVQPPPTEKRSS